MPKGQKDREGRREAKLIAQMAYQYVMKAYQLGCVDGIDILHEKLEEGRAERKKELALQADVTTTGGANGGKVVLLRKRRRRAKVARDQS